MVLYERLQHKAGDDIKARMKLTALDRTLSDFGVVDPEERKSIAENILKFDEMARDTSFEAADKRVQKLIEMHTYFKKQLDD